MSLDFAWASELKEVRAGSRFMINESVSKSELCISVSRWGCVGHARTKPRMEGILKQKVQTLTEDYVLHNTTEHRMQY